MVYNSSHRGSRSFGTACVYGEKPRLHRRTESFSTEKFRLGSGMRQLSQLVSINVKVMRAFPQRNEMRNARRDTSFLVGPIVALADLFSKV